MTFGNWDNEIYAFLDVVEEEFLTGYFDFCNRRRPHSTLDANTPNGVYFNRLPLATAA